MNKLGPIEMLVLDAGLGAGMLKQQDKKMNKLRIRFKLKSGQWTYWLNADEIARYRTDQIKEAVIEETMSYEEAMKIVGGKVLSAEK